MRFTFTPEVAPELLALRSIYAWRLFECLQSWKDKGRWTPTLDEFRTAMDAPESCREDFFNLRARIIQPAVNELRTKDNLLIDWQPVKSGQRYVGLVFTFRPDPQGRLAI